MSVRLIIADDELKIIELIKALGHWEELDIEIVNECCTGAQALNALLEYKPDIALLDIMMPGLDGIQVIEKAKEQGLDTVFIILSGYRHFEYAKNAIQLGVIDYLLKPLDEAQLNVTMKKACDYHKRKIQQDAMKMSLKSLENQQKERALAKYWKYVLSGLSEEAYEKPYMEDILSIDFPFEQPYIIVIVVRSNLDNLLTQSGSIFEEKITSFIQQALGSSYPYLYNQNPYGLYIQASLKNELQVNQVKILLNQLYDRIYQLYEVYGQFEYRIGYCVTQNHISGLPDAYANAQAALLDTPPHVRVSSYQSDTMNRSYQAKNSIMSEKDTIIYKRGLANMEEETIHLVFNTLRGYLMKQKKVDTKQVLCQLQFMIGIANKEEVTADDGDTMLNILDLIAHSDYTLNGVLNIAEDEIISRIRLCKQNEQSKIQKVIKRSESFIHQNYYHAISLEDVAEHVGLSSNYLSVLFKQEKGVGFLQYLTDVRIDAAKEMLTNTYDSCRNIAKQIGYNDEKYFLKLFKKQVGLSPSEYRKLFQ